MTYGHNGGPPLAPIDPKAAGWIRVNRDIRDHHLVGFGRTVTPCDPKRGSYSRAEAFLDLVMECRYNEGKVNNGGKVMTIMPGQLVGAISWLASRWNWTPKTVRWFLAQLETDGMISRTTVSPDNVQTKPQRGNQNGNQANIITICNYSKYQAVDYTQGQSDWQSSGNQGAIEGQSKGNIYKEEQLYKGTREQIDSSIAAPASATPEPPAIDKDQILASMGIDQMQLDMLRQLADPARAEAFQQFAAKQQSKRLRAERTANDNAKRAADADQAYSLYNKAAAHWGFSLCEARTEPRTRRLLQRIDDIGGIENFRLALRAIGKDPFLSGRTPPKPGQKPFRLDMERLLSTDSRMGDVLAKLLDLAGVTDGDEHGPSPNGRVWGWWRSEMEKLKSLPADYWRRRIDTLKPNGTWPWWELGAPPGHDETIVHPDVVAELGLEEIYKGQVKHD